MPETEETVFTFMQEATPAMLEEAVAQNHIEWLSLLPEAAGGEVIRSPEVTYTFSSAASHGSILFPRFTPDTADQQLAAILAFYRERKPEKRVGCWSLIPSIPPDLEVRLLARGFQLGWQPNWMWLDLKQIQTDFPQPEGLQVIAADVDTLWEVKDLPYYSDDFVLPLHAAMRQHPKRTRHFVALLNGKLVGQSVVFLTLGERGIGGIYNVGVVPEARNQGIGKAVTIAACQFAQQNGCRHVLLNGTGERMYRQIGFTQIGLGQTWWLDVPRLESTPPTETLIRLTEAVGRGDTKALAALEGEIGSVDLDAPLANNMTLLQIATHCQQTDAAEWLVMHGASLDVLTAWDIGWKERAAELLAEHPELANRQSGELQTTPLHEAIERNDIELARLLLTAKPDINIKDSVFHATPEGWARHFQRTEILSLLERFRETLSQTDR